MPSFCHESTKVPLKSIASFLSLVSSRCMLKTRKNKHYEVRPATVHIDLSETLFRPPSNTFHVGHTISPPIDDGAMREPFANDVSIKKVTSPRLAINMHTQPRLFLTHEPCGEISSGRGAERRSVQSSHSPRRLCSSHEQHAQDASQSAFISTFSPRQSSNVSSSAISSPSSSVVSPGRRQSKHMIVGLPSDKGIVMENIPRPYPILAKLEENVIPLGTVNAYARRQSRRESLRYSCLGGSLDQLVT